MGSVIGQRIGYNGVGALRGQGYMQKLTQVPPLYHLRKRIHVMNKIKRVRRSYVYRTLDFDTP